MALLQEWGKNINKKGSFNAMATACGEASDSNQTNYPGNYWQPRKGNYRFRGPFTGGGLVNIPKKPVF